VTATLSQPHRPNGPVTEELEYARFQRLLQDRELHGGPPTAKQRSPLPRSATPASNSGNDSAPFCPRVKNTYLYAGTGRRQVLSACTHPRIGDSPTLDTNAWMAHRRSGRADLPSGSLRMGSTRSTWLAAAERIGGTPAIDPRAPEPLPQEVPGFPDRFSREHIRRRCAGSRQVGGRGPRRRQERRDQEDEHDETSALHKVSSSGGGRRRGQPGRRGAPKNSRCEASCGRRGLHVLVPARIRPIASTSSANRSIVCRRSWERETTLPRR
jgi:hypothetical protein